MRAFDHLVPMDPGVGQSDAAQPNQIPSWLVKILDYTESAVDGFRDYSALRGYYARISRGTNMAAKADVLSSNTLRHSPVILYIPRGNLETKLESHIYKSNPISKITIVNVAEMKGTISKLQEIEYEQCYVQQLEPVLDWLLVELKITKYTNTLFKYKTDGSLEGKDMATIDCTLKPKIDVHIDSNSSSSDEQSEEEQNNNNAQGNDVQDDSVQGDKAQDDSDSPILGAAKALVSGNIGAALDSVEGFLPPVGKQALGAAKALASGDIGATLDSVEGFLPPAGKKALGAVKALAGGDKRALAQSAMSLLGGDHNQHVNKAKKVLGRLKSFF